MAGPALTTANPNVIARPSTENEVNELIRTSGGVENVSELARRLGWTRSKLIRFLDQAEAEGWITCSISLTGRALIAMSGPVRTPEQPTERRNVIATASPVEAGGIGRGVVGLVLVGAGITLAVTSMQANAWSGYFLTTDETAAEFFQGCR
jgi:hypothetical protein